MCLFSLLAALLPTLFLIWLLWWLDRYEREPTALIIAAFMWGAVPAILLSLVTELLMGAPLGGGEAAHSLVQAAVIPPFVEESFKGLALLGLLRFSRHEIDGVLDGVIYGALVGAGFAMTENFLYFMSSESAGALALTIFLRAFVFGLNHLLYTATFGAAVALSMGFGAKLGRGLVLIFGLGLAMFFHGIHNFSVTQAGSEPLLLVLSLAANWGGTLAFFTLILVALQRERRIIQAYLASTEGAVLNAVDRKRLTAIWPPRERFIPDFPWLDSGERRENRLYQYVAELALRRHRLNKQTGPNRAHLEQEIMALQEKIVAITQARANSDTSTAV